MKLVAFIKRILGKVIRFTYSMLYKFISIDNKMVIFISFHGKGYSDNPKAIFEEMKKDERFKDYRFIWAIKHHKDKDITIEGAKIIEYFSIPYFYYLSKAKYWIFNCKMPNYIKKKPEQIYLQTWHGTPLKRLGKDIIVPEGTTFYRSQMTSEEMKNSYDVDVARYNYMIAPNHFCFEVFQSAFGIESSKLIETGYPRNDILSNVDLNRVIEKKKKLNIPLDKKVILYAPTWRDNSYVAKGYTFELQVDFDKWKEILGEEYVVLFKPHYLIINKYQNRNDGFIINVGADQDIAELYEVADILVTDYSSVFFDYAILNRPVYFYMYDIDEYKNDLRGFYLDIYKDIPGEVYLDESKMLEDIKNEHYDFDKLHTFNERFNHMEDGNAASRVIDIVFNLK